jgi:hypothetical protein
MRTALVVAGLVLACACGSSTSGQHDAPVAIDAGVDAGPDPDDGAASGSRLKLVWFNFADGTRTWAGFYDAQRKESCTVSRDEPWTGGHTYCIPDHGGTIVYSDAACTQKLAQVFHDPSCSRPPPIYVVEGTTTCDYVAQHLYTRGDPAAPTSYYLRFGDGSCTGPFPSAGYDFYQLGLEIQPTALVELVLGAPTSAARLSERFYQTVDGMKLPAAIHDAMLGGDCRATGTAGNLVCLPDAAAASLFHDPACTEPEAALPASCAAPPYLVANDTCPSAPPHLYTAGSPVAAPPLYRLTAGTCATANGSTNNTYYPTDQRVTVARLEAVTETVSGRRLQLVHDTTSEGLSFRAGVHDTEGDTDCAPTVLPDGTVRCLPVAATVTTYYTDAQCMTAIDVVEVPTGPPGCGAPTLPRYAHKTVQPPPSSCQYSLELHTITGPYTGPLYRDNSLGCSGYAPAQTAFFTIGPAAALTEFEGATLSTDP